MGTSALFSSNNIILNKFSPKIGNKSLTKEDLKNDYYDDADKKSWRYLPSDNGLYSTQQLDVDWTNFAQHTFFNSAEVKVNAAYERIVNHFPYDGDQKEKTPHK